MNRSSIRRSRRRGAALVMGIMAGALLLGIMSLFVDFGLVFTTRKKTEFCAEEAAHRALSEFWMADHGSSFTLSGSPPNWAPRFREDPVRAAARAVGLQYTIGPTMTFTDYTGDIQLNAANSTSGDIILGNWAKASGGAYSFTAVSGTISGNSDIPNAVRVVVRRTRSSQVNGVSDGDNPIPHVLGWGASGPQGLQTRSVITVANVPAAMIGPGTTVTRADGSTARTGCMPIVLILRSGVTTWLDSSTIGATITVDLDRTPNNLGGGFEGWFTDFGFSGGAGPNAAGMMRYLGNVSGTQIAPPMVRLNDQPSTQNMNNSNMNTCMNLLNSNFLNRTFTIPLVADNANPIPSGARLRVAGFAHVRCTAVNVSGRTVTFMRAPSGVTLNAGSLNSCLLSFGGSIPTNVQSGGTIRNLWLANFWTIVDSQYVTAQPWGVSCTGATVRFRP